MDAPQPFAPARFGFTPNGDFNASLLFLHRFGTAPSEWYVPVEAAHHRKNVRVLRSMLEAEGTNWKLYLLNWSMNSREEHVDTEDVPYLFIYVNEPLRSILRVRFDEDKLYLEVYYETNSPDTEVYLIHLIEGLRDSLARQHKPVFHVLTVRRNSYSTTEVGIDPPVLDVEQHYNDDFAPVDQLIRAAIDEPRSGILLLHGTPGTGKTTYIKHLIAEHRRTKFIFVANDFVSQLLKPGFVTFMLDQKDAVLVIEDAEKVIASRDGSGKNSVVSTILQLTDGLFSDFLNLKIICTFNTNVDRIDKALFRKGRMIAFYEFSPLAAEKANRLLLDRGAEPTSEPLPLAEIYNREHRSFEQHRPQRIGFG